MLIQFQIGYKTLYGQRIMLTGSLPQMGSGEREEAVAMHYVPHSDGIWTYLIKTDSMAPFEYRYFLKEDHSEITREEWGENRYFDPGKSDVKFVLLSDHWRSLSDPDIPLLSSAFTAAVFKPTLVPRKEIQADYYANPGIELCFRPLISRVMPGHRIYVCGSTEILGNWDEKKALPLDNQDYPYWNGVGSVPVSDFPVEYKYLVRNSEGETLFWEKCPNRVIKIPENMIPNYVVIRDERFDFTQELWRGAGLAIPVFSLRREDGWGIGEFSDLKGLTDWAAEAGLQLIQTLPVNDTIAGHTWKDSYPYAAISVFALHPAYINLSDIGKLEDKVLQNEMEEKGRLLNSLDKMDFEAVMILKSRFFKLMYDQQKEGFLKDPEFQLFFEKNRYWLEPYAAFSTLRDRFHTPDFSQWGRFAQFTPGLLAEICNPADVQYDDIAIHYFIQYHAHLQLSKATEYARSKGVALKGDLPIGIFRHSVDAWVSPELYHMECQTGAPPDDFSASGQNWRFPTYNWEVMAVDHYSWWQKRLRHLSEYFDAFRIDHILGFFRIWEIPQENVQGILGYFNPSIPYSRNEILAKGIYFDETRYCRPYIREHILPDIFGEESEFIKNRFLHEYAPGCFALIPEFNTQLKVEKYMDAAIDASPEEISRLKKIREGLFALIAEVIFIEKANGSEIEYFPRHSMHSTYSFRDLDDHSRQMLNELYIEYFYRRNEELWRKKALIKLPALKSSTNMLLCGEDLGMVPACVPGVMNDMGLLSLEVQRMPKDPKLEFGVPSQYPYLSVATPSSHDTSTIRGWWEENPEKTQIFFNQILGNPGQAPGKCTTEIVRQIVTQHLYSNSMWAIFPLQDVFGMDEKIRLPDPHAERINEPGNPEQYWQYRMHLTVEKLLEQSEFNQKIREMISDSGRNRLY
jgi:4-alpha-glucanotransferase